jgi:hypothetical protein
MQIKQPHTTISAPAIAWADVVTLALGLIALTLGLGGYGFYEPHEGHFGGVAREMLLRGDWITPTLNGAPYLNKPPLLYWLIATSTALFGFTEFAARLPLAIIGWVGAVVAWKWARELWNPASGRVAALMLSVAFGWFMFTHQILIDVLLSTLLLAAYYCLWRVVWKGGWVYFLALYVLLGLCVLAKGPFSLVFPFIGYLALAIQQRNWAISGKLRQGLGAGVTLLVTLPWVIAVERANPGFLNYFLFNENLKRIADTRWPPDYEVSKVSAIGYLAVTAIWCVPWILVLPQAVHSAWKDIQQGNGKAGEAGEAGGEEKSQSPVLSPQSRRTGVSPVFPSHQSKGLPKNKLSNLVGQVSRLPLGQGGPDAHPTRGSWIFFCLEVPKIQNPKSDGVLLLVIAAVLPVLLFLPLSSRLVYYSIPAIAPFVILCAGWWSRCQEQSQRRGRMAAGVSCCLLGLGACSATSIWAPELVMGLPELANAPDLSSIVRAIALFIGSGCLIGGILMLLCRPNWALIAILTGFVSAYVASAHGFAAVQDFRSSKTLIETANLRLGLTTLWVFEGSRELGAAGAMSYYLDRQGNHNLSDLAGSKAETGVHTRTGEAGEAKEKISPMKATWYQSKIQNLPLGWAKGKHNTAYRVVLVLTDGGPNRLPPSFPGPRPGYALTKRELQEYWDSPRPVVFVTDFLRKPDSQRSRDELLDPPNLNLPNDSGDPLLVVGPRKLYGNFAARELWFQKL